MGQMSYGRKSAASLSVVCPTGIDQRPAAPDDLTGEQGRVWDSIVRRMPVAWFPAETHPVLVQYCRHTVAAGHIAQLIDQCAASAPIDVVAYDILLKMQDRESRVIMSLATKMRMTQQASYTHKTANTAKRRGGARPWALEDSDQSAPSVR